MDWDECEIPEFYDEACHTARKLQRCCECRKPIEPGEKYVACSGKSDGRFWTFKQHFCCYHIARLINHELRDDGDYNGCIPFGEIKTYLQECSPFGSEACVDVENTWMNWVAGIKEQFAMGAGI